MSVPGDPSAVPPSPRVVPRQKPGNSTAGAVIIAVAAVSLMAGVAMGAFLMKFAKPAPTEDASAPPPMLGVADNPMPPTEDPDHLAVRAWLLEKRDNQPWHELRWWPTREGTASIKNRVAIVNALLADPDLNDAAKESARAYLKKLESETPVKICRLRYRATVDGDTKVVSDTFIVADGKVTPLSETIAEDFPE